MHIMYLVYYPQRSRQCCNVYSIIAFSHPTPLYRGGGRGQETGDTPGNETHVYSDLDWSHLLCHPVGVVRSSFSGTTE